jgi:LytS/YehU family sensor histidine kinase
MATNTYNWATKLFTHREKVNDIGIRAVLVPLFGISIPLISQMVPHDQFTNWQVKLSYLYNIGIAFVIYEGTRFLHFTLRTYFDWFNKPVRKILALVTTIPFFVVPASTLMLVGWYHIFMHGLIDWKVLKLTVIIILIAVFFLVNLYETVFLVRDVATDKIQKEQLERARAEAELEALKNQIDPHFIFNSLNTLSHLIDAAPGKAKLFNDHLAEVYRYILQNKARDLVLLSEETGFLKNYFALLKIRFGQSVFLHLEIPEMIQEQYLVPPISLQILVENAIKHNEFSDEMPLHIWVRTAQDKIVVTNDIRKKLLHKASSGIGLQNLNERYRLITGKTIEIINNHQSFKVLLPLLPVG